MRVNVQRGFYIFVPKAFWNGERREIQFNKQAGVRVPEIVQAYSFYACFFYAIIKLAAQVKFIKGRE